MRAEVGKIAARHKEITPAIACDKADHGRMLFVAVADDHVVDDRDLFVAGIKNGAIQDLRNVKHTAKMSNEILALTL